MVAAIVQMWNRVGLREAFFFLVCNIWTKRNERPSVRVVSIRNRKDVPSA